MKLEQIEILTGKIILETGLHIGGSDAEIKIGGIDNEVIKNPLNGEPYIPGSSLKGKIRSLMEWKTGEVKEQPLNFKDYKNANNKDAVKVILQLFGNAGDNKDDAMVQEIGHTRLAFWDCALSQETRDLFNQRHLSYTESKAENTINRISGTAANPRNTERVPAGVKFDFKISLKKFAGDEDLQTELLKGLKLLEMDSLGGSGSRGYGKVKFQFDNNELQEKFNQIKPFE